MAGAWTSNPPACTAPPLVAPRLPVAAASPIVSRPCTFSLDPAPSTRIDPMASLSALAMLKLPPLPMAMEPAASTADCGPTVGGTPATPKPTGPETVTLAPAPLTVIPP